MHHAPRVLDAARNRGTGIRTSQVILVLADTLLLLQEVVVLLDLRSLILLHFLLVCISLRRNLLLLEPLIYLFDEFQPHLFLLLSLLVLQCLTIVHSALLIELLHALQVSF